MSHTKGPWSAKYGGPHVFSNDGVVAIAEYPEGPGGGNEMIANAHLIAAAPEMLKALERCRIYLSACKKETFPVGFIESVDAAIAEAKGAK